MNNSPEAYLAGRGTWATTPQTMARDLQIKQMAAGLILTRLEKRGHARRIKRGYYVHASMITPPGETP